MPNSANSMSQNFGQQQQLGSFNFTPNGFQRSEILTHQHQHQQQQIPRDKLLRLQGFAPPLASIGEEEPLPLPSAVYETNGMLSEMFNFPPAAAPELLEHHSSNFRNSPPPPTSTNDQWYGSRQGMMCDRTGHVHHHMSKINEDSAAAMQLFAMNPQPTSPSPPPAAAMNSSSALFPQAAQFQWRNSSGTSEHGGGGQGLSLSLSSSLKGRLESAKAEELRIGDVGSNMLFFNTGNHNQGTGAGASTATSSNSVGGAQSHHRPRHHHHLLYSDNFGYPHQINQHHQLSMGLRNSKYAKATQELLEEFCSVGKEHDRFRNKNPKFGNPSTNWKCGDSSSSSKDPPPLSPSERTEHHRRKVKLLSMLDEVDRRYNHYCEQMQTVVNSFDVAMGYGAAVPYTALAQKAMSRHFRCLKDAIAEQVRHSCEQLGNKDGGGCGASGSGGGITKGETPRLRLLEQSLRQQRAFHHMGMGMGMMEQEAWRPQRGLPERSVNILRAWLFEHFLHPYPSDADKLLLARQTGLSRNQVSNWFINARVRLWKPMVEEMYQQESKDNDDDQNDAAAAEDTEMKPSQSQSQSQNSSTSGHLAQTPTTIPTATVTGKGSETNKAGPDSDASLLAINRQRGFSENQATQQQQLAAAAHNFAGGVSFPAFPGIPESQGFTATTAIQSELQRHHNHRVGGVEDACRRGSSMVGTAAYGTTSAGGADVAGPAQLIRFGTTAGDVSLTLGLRHAGNQPEKSHFSVGGFGRC